MPYFEGFVNKCPHCGSLNSLKYDDKKESKGRGLVWCEKCGYRSANASSMEQAVANVMEGREAEPTTGQYVAYKLLRGAGYAVLACLILPITVLIDLVRRQK